MRSFLFPNQEQESVLIVGAGISGLVLARQFKKLGFRVCVIEKKSNLSSDGAGIALPANAVKVLRYLGLDSQVVPQAHQVNKIIYTDAKGNVLSEASLLEAPLNQDRFIAMHRQSLQNILYDNFSDEIYFSTTIEKMDFSGEKVHVNFKSLAEAAPPSENIFSAVIGADGVHSCVRKLAFSDASLIDLGVTTWRWISSYPTEELQPTYMLDARSVFMAYPIGNNQVYCYAHMMDPNKFYFKQTDHSAVLRAEFAHYEGIAKELLNNLPEDTRIISGRLQSVRIPVFSNDRVALVGDASHACSPMLQQGAASALEDVIALYELFAHFPVKEALSYYKAFRKARVNWITEASDGRLKVLQVDPSSMYDQIREKGPLNVQGWKQLLQTDFIEQLNTFIKERKAAHKEEKLTPAMTAKF